MRLTTLENVATTTQPKNKTEIIYRALLEQKARLPLGLFTGLSGITLLHCIASQKEINLVHYLDELFTQAEDPKTVMTFCSGLSGMGWMIELMSKHNDIIDDTNEILSDLDEVVIRWMKAEIQNYNYDFMHGAIGGALYLLKRFENHPSEHLILALKEFTKKLIAQAQSTPSGGLYWIQKAGILRTEEDRINFGLSHGFPSILVFLCKVYQAGLLQKELLPVINKIVHYLLNHTVDPVLSGNYFPTYLYPNNPEKNVYDSRLAWCYGDISVCLALWHANQIIQSSTLDQFIIEVLKLASSQRGHLENRIRDAGLCHGSAGLGYLFHRFHERYAIDDFAEASQYWFNKTYELSNHQEGPAGFMAYTPLSATNYAVEFGMLEGIAGIYSCIQTAKGNLASDWDEMFLIS
jgi:lantibiotic modifying enzyme